MSVKMELWELVERLSDREAAEMLSYMQWLTREGQAEPEDDLDTLIARQGVEPIADPMSLAKGIWPEDEPVDDFLAARVAWKHAITRED